MKQNTYKRPQHWSMATFDKNTGAIQFNTKDIRGAAQAATDPSAYAEALVGSLDMTLNSNDWREAAMDHFPCEFRPAGSEATGQQIITLADRSVTFDPREVYDGTYVQQVWAPAGSFVFTETTDKALLISHRISIFDHNVQAGWTEGSLVQTVEKLLMDIELAAAGEIAEILEASTEGVRQVSGTLPTSGTLAEKADDYLDQIVDNLDYSLGTGLSDFMLMVPVALSSKLDRAAQRAGHENLEAYLGTSVQSYSGTDRGVFLLPRMFTSLSFRQRTSGDVWKVIATRNGAYQAWDIEIMAVVDLLAMGKVQVALDADGLQTEAVSLPLITQMVFS